MIQINLLPEEKKRVLREVKIRAALIEVSIVSLLILVMFVVGILLLIGVYSLTSANFKKEIDSENKKLSKYEKLENQIVKYQANTDLYDKLISQRISWSEALLVIQEVVPTGVQFTNISIKQEEDEKSLSVSAQGLAIDRREVAKLIKKLKDSDNFSQVHLSSSNLTQEGKADFKISFNYLP